MKLIDKLKNAIFEDEDDEQEVSVKKKKEKVKEEKIKDRVKINDNNFSEDEVVKKIDIEKTIPKDIELPKIEEPEEEKKEVVETKLDKAISLPRREHRRTPVIFNEDDFVMEEDEIVPPIKEVEKPEIPKKVLYGGYRDEKTKGKFKPSPVLSPVYGFVGVSPVLEQPRNDDISSYSEMYAKEKQDIVTVDQVRRKAYGIESSKEEEDDDDLGLLYDMQQEDKPAISKITLGDAEEYFDDLGLEYNVDYKDVAKERSQVDVVPEVEEKVVPEPTAEEKVEKEKKIEETQQLEITKEQLRPRTAKEIKKVKKIKDIDLDDAVVNEPVDEEPDEKNLYDLIDMMYDSKE